MDHDSRQFKTIRKRKGSRKAQRSFVAHATHHVHNRKKGSAPNAAVQLRRAKCMGAHSKAAAATRDRHVYNVLDVLARE